MPSLSKKVVDKASKKSKKKKKKKQDQEAEEGTNDNMIQGDAAVPADEASSEKAKKKKKKKKRKSSKQDEEAGTEQPAEPISSAPKKKKSRKNKDSSPPKPEPEKTVVDGICFLCKLPGHKARLVSWILNPLFRVFITTLGGSSFAWSLLYPRKGVQHAKHSVYNTYTNAIHIYIYTFNTHQKLPAFASCILLLLTN